MQLDFEAFWLRLDTPTNRLIAALCASALLISLLAYLFRAWRRRAARRKQHEQIISVSAEFVRNVLIPDGMGNVMHVDYLLLTSRGIIVLDLREVRGNIFGGDQMTEWTVMNGPVRSTFPNPQHALFDRVAAVKQLSGEVPVEGRVLFTELSKFPKGLPRWTLTISGLTSEFPAADSEQVLLWIDSQKLQWRELQASLSPSPLHRAPGFLSEVFRS